MACRRSGRRGDAVNTEDIQHAVNAVRDEVSAAIRKFHESTDQTIIGTFEVYIHRDGRVEYRVKADSQLMFEANDYLGTPAKRLTVLEMYLACHDRAARLGADVEALNAMHEAFEAWRRKSTQFTYDGFVTSAARIGVHPALES